MLLDCSARRVAAKEITLFFASPVAYLFLGVFAAVTLFAFFWGEAFFARNIADVRPLFEWLPLLLIFLCSTLTMRMWSEERRTGTLEHVLTQPVPLWSFVVGKFAACLALLAVALLITLPLPITVALLADLDWGPVWAGYLATLLLGAAYLSTGLFVSARSSNQIVSLIGSMLLCGLLYLIGSPLLTELVSIRWAELLRLLGTGARFESISRGVIDLRDLYYYFSLIAAFLMLNLFSLERERWAATGDRRRHRAWYGLTTLVVLNALCANLWLGSLNGLRIDATEGRLYSLSDASRQQLQQLREPLLIRGYFSSNTHPLLAPLVPQLHDLVKEYGVAGEGRVRVELIDPAEQPALEQEANQKYGIQPVPFQIADRHQASLVNSYFNLLIQYGDDYQTLGFRDLIEVKSQGEAQLDVRLRNPEYDITRAIKKVLQSYQSGGNLFDSLQGRLTFTGYVSPDEQLPEALAGFRALVQDQLEALREQAGERLEVSFVDPQADGGQVARRIAEEYGFQPMVEGLLSERSFYFYLTLSRDDQVVQIPLADLSEESFKRNLEAAIKRFAAGFTKTVALVTPQPAAGPMGYGGGAQFYQLQDFLAQELNVRDEELSDGRVEGDADLLMLMAPEQLDEAELFAVDQFLMRGGTVIVASSPFRAELADRRLSLSRHESGLQAWLAHHGLSIDDSLVLDPQNSALPVPVTRQAGGFRFQELHMLDYPYLVEAGPAELNGDNAITANLPRLTLAWASPLQVDADKNANRSVTELIRSSAGAWRSDSLDVMPRLDADGRVDYRPQGEVGRQLLAVVSEGRFDSYFAGKPLPAKLTGQATADEDADDASHTPAPTGVIERSPESARIILFGSNDFLSDQVLQLVGAGDGIRDLSGLQLMANAVDWSLEDRALLAIRGRSHFNRTLPPLDADSQLTWEYLNYGLAVLALGGVALLQRQRMKSRRRRYLELLST
ncbi:Gldg family protein [Marinobacterium arenosum]|uniref:Gldg family protein n=1 Tax=Marinobacterium arenosum TaxID=2862496 RepID=UPI001C94FF4B|nr:Gldg family protein [Marinobacterium arenosum]MBY4677027.1 Gldg family protein [Marinobacterium arenosum]